MSDFKFMPVDTDRLLKSETWQLGNGEQKAAAITLWLESWHQLPAGSLPSNDRLLSKLSQCDHWTKVREHALRGWIPCSDGRLYHPVVCEKVLEAWIEKLAAAIAGAAGNAKRWGVAVDGQPMRQQFRVAVELLRGLAPQSRALKKKIVAVILAGSPPESPPDKSGEGRAPSPPDSGPDRKGQGQGQGQGQGFISSPGVAEAPPVAPSEPPPVSPAPKPQGLVPTPPAPKPPAKAKEPGQTVATWGAYSMAYRQRYGADPVRNAKVNGQLSQLVTRLGADEAPQVAEFYVGHTNPRYVREMHTVDLLLHDAEALRTQWATGRRAPIAASLGVIDIATRNAEARKLLGFGNPSSAEVFDA